MSPNSNLHKGISCQAETLQLLQTHKESIPETEHRGLHGEHDDLHSIATYFMGLGSIRSLVSYKGIRDFKKDAQDLNSRTKLSSVKKRTTRLWTETGGPPQPMPTPRVPSPTSNTPVPADSPFADPPGNNDDYQSNLPSSHASFSENETDSEGSSTAIPLRRRRTYDGDMSHSEALE